MKLEIPKFVRPFLWSYDISQVDSDKEKKRIITNILNFGTKEATDWLFSKFEKEDICKALENPFPGEWNKKSINFWSIVLNIKIGDTNRQIS